MRLAQFIRRHRSKIIAKWATFAATMRPMAADISRSELRRHAGELLDAVADDLDAPQSREEQERKGNGFGRARRMAAVAQRHALRRMRVGFRLPQVLAEYRALRASVARLWEDYSPRSSALKRRELTRFHEAIDEALTESINRYNAQLEQYREQFLAILGHDLRNPLAAIVMSATSLARADDITDKHAVTARRIENASARMARLVNALLDLTHTRLGEGIRISSRRTNLGNVCRAVVDEIEAAYPGRSLVLECNGDLDGIWDSDRLAQIVTNLIANAIQHGDPDRPVTIRAVARADIAVLTVHNHGKAIPLGSLKTIFDPMVRSSDGRDGEQSTSLGLGLFIVRELVSAHRGTVRVSSDGDGTTFIVSLPRGDVGERKLRPSATVEEDAVRERRSRQRRGPTERPESEQLVKAHPKQRQLKSEGARSRVRFEPAERSAIEARSALTRTRARSIRSTPIRPTPENQQ